MSPPPALPSNLAGHDPDLAIERGDKVLDIHDPGLDFYDEERGVARVPADDIGRTLLAVSVERVLDCPQPARGAELPRREFHEVRVRAVHEPIAARSVPPRVQIDDYSQGVGDGGHGAQLQPIQLSLLHPGDGLLAHVRSSGNVDLPQTALSTDGPNQGGQSGVSHGRSMNRADYPALIGSPAVVWVGRQARMRSETGCCADLTGNLRPSFGVSVLYLADTQGKHMTALSKLPSKFSSLAVLAGLGLLVLSGCVAGTGGRASSSPAASSAPEASATPGGSPAAGFYLRAWQTQALAPQYTFGGLPVVTIADGRYIDGRVAVPAIYPGPIYIGPFERTISAKGVEAIVAEARADGLLGDKADFSDPRLVGGITAHIRLVVDGVTHDLTGPMPTDATTTAAAPGTASAFAAFWNRIGTIDFWLAAELGQSEPYSPASIAVLLTPPADAAAGITASEVAWPLASPFSAFGGPYGGSVYRCATVTGADLAKLLPVVQASNALTRFVDSTGAKVSLQVRVLLPGEASPCG